MRESDQERQGAAALADIFETHYERVARYIAVRIGRRDQAEELAADVFVRALERIHTFTWRGIPIQAWLFRIAHNLTVDYLRRNSHRKTSPLEEASYIASSDNTEGEALKTFQREELLQAMDSLTTAQREVVTLRFFAGLTSAEVAQVVKRTNGAVRELQSSALKTLRRILNPSRMASLEVEGGQRL